MVYDVSCCVVLYTVTNTSKNDENNNRNNHSNNNQQMYMRETAKIWNLYMSKYTCMYIHVRIYIYMLRSRPPPPWSTSSMCFAAWEHHTPSIKTFFHEVASYCAVRLHKVVQHLVDISPKSFSQRQLCKIPERSLVRRTTICWDEILWIPTLDDHGLP